jgi:predicted HicB family RNase H-like nuclease
LSWLDKEPESALKGIREVVENVIEDMKHTGEEAPQPIACKRYSGKFMVRVPPDVHRNLAMQASESGVSLNRIAGAKLSR